MKAFLTAKLASFDCGKKRLSRRSTLYAEIIQSRLLWNKLNDDDEVIFEMDDENDSFDEKLSWAITDLDRVE